MRELMKLPTTTRVASKEVGGRVTLSKILISEAVS